MPKGTVKRIPAILGSVRNSWLGLHSLWLSSDSFMDFFLRITPGNSKALLAILTEVKSGIQEFDLGISPGSTEELPERTPGGNLSWNFGDFTQWTHGEF